MMNTMTLSSSSYLLSISFSVFLSLCIQIKHKAQDTLIRPSVHLSLSLNLYVLLFVFLKVYSSIKGTFHGMFSSSLFVVPNLFISVQAG